MRTALIVGASGLTGRQCLYQLLDSNMYGKVTALVRKPMPLRHAHLEQLVVDFDHLGAHAARLAADDIFCCLGTTIKVAGSQQQFRRVDHDYPLAIAQAALAGGAQCFLLISAMGADPQSRIFYNRVKGETEAAIAALGYPSAYFLRPSLLLGSRKELRAGERIAQLLMWPLRFLFAGPLRKYRPIEAITVARAMLKAAQTQMPGTHVLDNAKLLELGKGKIPKGKGI